ncbi:MAG: porin [Paludisphaera borealis]|uniref:porin n=1 Tax=Paludisphaera borealis TaxID=1387353 RepID=UPI00283CD5BF|nr:porin [Paludisphaera borealis]MDR3623329.1 porin [Paludisphaera borealis]
MPQSYFSKSKLRFLWIAALLVIFASPAHGDDPPAPDKLDALLDRFQKMEETNRKLNEKLDQLSKENTELSKEVRDLSKQVKQPAEPAAKTDAKAKPKNSGLAGQGAWEKAIEHERANREAGKSPGEELLSSAVTSGGARASEPQGVGNRYLGKIPLRAYFDYAKDGLGFATDDDEFELKFRSEIQIDNLVFPGPAQQYIHGGVYLSRARYYFQGHFTKPIDYQLSFQRSFTSFGFLNAFLNFNYDKRLQLRIGRFKPPFTYEWYKLNNYRFITPERPLYAENFGLNRMEGIMGWGMLFDDRMEYAAGVFAGPRNSDQDYNAQKDVAALLNFRPFMLKDGVLKNLNFGGSVDYGMQDNPANPAVLRSNINASANAVNATDAAASVGIPFLAFNSDVVERGKRELWDLHLAYFYEGFSLIGAWGSGINSMSKKSGAAPVPLSVDGWHVAMAYLLTGETMNERTVIDPIHRFDLRKGMFGLGAFEPFARYSFLEVGKEVFTQGLADPNLWTNRIQMTDVGVNWYLNRLTKIYIDWQHSMYAEPVFYKTGGLRSTSDIFWVRFQFYY